MRGHRSFSISSSKQIKDALLEWSRPYNKVVWLDGNHHKDKYGKFEAIMAVGRQTDRSFLPFTDIDEIPKYIDNQKDWLFGYFSYDLKNKIENLSSNNFDGLHFPEIYFFRPEKVITLKEGKLNFHYLENVLEEVGTDYDQIQSIVQEGDIETLLEKSIRIKMRIHKDAYFEKAQSLLKHIHRGDIYEANFCQEFYAEDIAIDPWEAYKNLMTISAPPFASFLRIEDKYLLCSSPERFLCKRGQTVVSQPIKGTAPRGGTKEEDKFLKDQLAKDEKERAENIMITDLVRNDLSKSALKGSVEVEELCKVYPFRQVHQMISTVTAKVPKNLNPVQLIKETFPMGSMTGAPKISAMKIIEELEETKRGLYSGAVGYFDPEENFDFNVVIRSILYNATLKYVSFSVGSAITAKSDPEKEYQECLLKAKAMRSVLEGS